MKIRYLITIDENVERPIWESRRMESGTMAVVILARTLEDAARMCQETVRLQGVSVG